MSVEDDYRKRRATVLERMAEKLGALLQSYCTGLHRIDRISARAKSVDRFLEKAAKLGDDGKLKYSDPLNEIQDQIGARIITFYLGDVELIEREVCQYFKAVEQKSLIPESESEFGYVGRHFILFVPTDVVEQDMPSGDVPKFFELQIKTLFQHAWAEANHDIAYKPPSPMSKYQKRQIAFTAAQAWGADQIFAELYKAMNK